MAVTLDRLGAGRWGRVVQVKSEEKARCAAFGIQVGRRVLCLGRGALGGAILIGVGQRRLVVGRGLAGKIRLEEEAECESR